MWIGSAAKQGFAAREPKPESPGLICIFGRSRVYRVKTVPVRYSFQTAR